MGRSGTDVAREAATMVLTDDDFATIIAAIGGGRQVFDNVRKFVLYIFAHAVPEVVPFLVFALTGGAAPLPPTVLQILAIDLGTTALGPDEASLVAASAAVRPWPSTTRRSLNTIGGRPGGGRGDGADRRTTPDQYLGRHRCSSAGSNIPTACPASAARDATQQLRRRPRPRLTSTTIGALTPGTAAPPSSVE